MKKELKNKKCNKCKNTKPITDFCKDKSTSDGYRYYCNECNRFSATLYYNNNKQKYIENAKRWRNNNPEKSKIISKKYKDTHKEKCNEYKKMYVKTHKKEMNYRSSLWYYSNKELAAGNRIRFRKNHPERNNLYRIANPDKYKIYAENRRARKLQSGVNISINEWNSLLDKYGHKCLCCGTTDKKLTMDHIIPLAVGGMHIIDNIQPLCMPCNSKKRTKIIDYRQE